MLPFISSSIKTFSSNSQPCCFPRSCQNCRKVQVNNFYHLANQIGAFHINDETVDGLLLDGTTAWILSFKVVIVKYRYVSLFIECLIPENQRGKLEDSKRNKFIISCFLIAEKVTNNNRKTLHQPNIFDKKFLKSITFYHCHSIILIRRKFGWGNINRIMMITNKYAI